MVELHPHQYLGAMACSAIFTTAGMLVLRVPLLLEKGADSGDFFSCFLKYCNQNYLSFGCRILFSKYALDLTPTTLLNELERLIL